MDLAAYWAEYNAEFDRARAGIRPADLCRLLEWLEEVRQRGRQLFVLGNGGSAASAAHWSCDFGKGCSVGQTKRFRVLAPNEQVPWHTALANDVSYADALAEQLGNWVGSGDLVVALSVSGDSENLVRACRVARQAGARVAAIVGAGRGRLAALADLAIVIPSRDYGVVEDLQMTINHALTQYLARRYRAELEPNRADEAATEQADVLALVRARGPAILEALEPQEADVLRLRFGLDDGVRHTLPEVAERLGLQVERIRQIEARAIHRLQGLARSG